MVEIEGRTVAGKIERRRADTKDTWKSENGNGRIARRKSPLMLRMNGAPGAGIDLCASWVMVPREIRGFALYKISESCALILQKEAEPMREANSGIANRAIEQILELSADAHIQKRGTVKDSPEFHKLTGAIAAYGKALALLTALQRQEEFYALIDQLEVPASAQPVC
jgi:hypothetical protein